MNAEVQRHHVGSNLDDFLAQDGLLAEVEAVAAKRVIAWQLAEAMRAVGMSKTTMARQMHTSRAAVERLLDPHSPSVTLLTLEKAARALGKRLEVRLE